MGFRSLPVTTRPATNGKRSRAFHGFKVDWYLHAAHETRRLTWRLAHAHGTFLAVVHVVFGHTVDLLKSVPRRLSWISGGLTMASLFVPLGFLLGGVKIYEGDPGPGIALLPIGALVLLVSLIDFAWSLPSARAEPEPEKSRLESPRAASGKYKR
jgi:hypothetical protein